jgi:hypothetical protein
LPRPTSTASANTFTLSVENAVFLINLLSHAIFLRRLVVPNLGRMLAADGRLERIGKALVVGWGRGDSGPHGSPDIPVGSGSYHKRRRSGVQ